MQSEKCNYKTELQAKGAISFVPGGISMWPILKNKGQSVIVVKKQGRLKPLDVAMYTRGETFVLHRVISPTEEGYIMCGDSQYALEKVAEDQVFGIMDGFYKGKKYIPVTDKGYIRRVKNWYNRKLIRKVRLGIFYYKIKLKNKLKKVFCKKEK